MRLFSAAAEKEMFGGTAWNDIEVNRLGTSGYGPGDKGKK